VPDFRPDSEATRHLLARIAAGDPAGVAGLLAHHRAELRTFVDLHLDRRVRARVDPSDVVQEVQVIVTRRLPEFLAGRPVPFHLWVRQLAYQRVLDVRRAHRAARRDVVREAVGPDRSSIALARSILCPGPSPSEAAEGREAAERAAQAVQTLPEADREILLLRWTEGLPFDEVAALLDIEPGTARQRFGRALRRLRKALAEFGIEGGDQ
jgi:RNA polymerase sigma-70 factor, ECF subfamily